MLTHHAYYIECPTSDYDSYHALFKPFHGEKYERFGINDARRLIELASLKNFKDMVFLIVTPSITTEAQQALLKLFEEPQVGTTFVLVVPPGILLPTLKSRMLVYPALDRTAPKDPTAVKFLKAPGKERSNIVAALLKDDEGARERVREFINELEAECVKLNFTQRPEGRRGLEDIAKVRDYLRDRSPGLKMLLEHLAVALPTV